MPDAKSVKAFIEGALGRFAGPEEMTVDPQTGATMKAVGRMENASALGAMALNSAYEQEVDGMISIRCQTLIRFTASGDVTMVWMPSQGDVATYQGRLDGTAIDVTRTDGDGLTHRIRTDYGKGSTVTNEMTLAFPGGGEAVQVFSARYERQP